MCVCGILGVIIMGNYKFKLIFKLHGYDQRPERNKYTLKDHVYKNIRVCG